MKKNILITILITIVISLISLSYLYYRVKLSEKPKEAVPEDKTKELDVLKWDNIKVFESENDKYILKTKKENSNIKYELTDSENNIILKENSLAENINYFKISIKELKTLYNYDYIMVSLNDGSHNYFVIHKEKDEYTKLVNIGSKNIIFKVDSKDFFDNYSIADSSVNFLYISNEETITFGTETIINNPCQVQYLKLKLNKKTYKVEKQDNPYTSITTNFKCNLDEKH